MGADWRCRRPGRAVGAAGRPRSGRTRRTGVGPLGPGGPWRASSVAVSSDWPADPFLVARLEPPGPPASSPRAPTPNDPPSTARSADGGRTWQAMSRVPSGTLDVIRTGQYRRVLLTFGADFVEQQRTDPGDRPLDRRRRHLVDRRQSAAGARRVHRTDRRPLTGDTRRRPANGPGGRQALRLAGCRPHLARFDPAAGQRIVGAVFSPEFARDRTIYLAAATTPHYLRPKPAEDPIYTAAADSAGVLVSRDGGASWSSLADGLQADGQPYRHVEELAISPTFARDGTLFVFAWGVWPRHTTADYDYVSPLMGLFRSRDRGDVLGAGLGPGPAGERRARERRGEPTGRGRGLAELRRRWRRDAQHEHERRLGRRDEL